MKKTLLYLTTILTLISIHANSHASDFADTFGLSPKGLSLGNAMCARVNDWSSTFYNVAGLGKSYGEKEYNNELAFAYISNTPDFKIDITRKRTSDGKLLATDGDKDLETGSLIFGLAIDIQQVFMELPILSTLRLGVVGGVNDDMTAVKINDLDPRTHNFVKYGRESQKLSIMNGLGMGFMNDSVGLGFGLNSSFGGDGKVLLENVELSTDAQYPVSTSTMDMKIEQSVIAGLYFSPGRLVDEFEGLEFGLSFRDESELNIDPFKTAASTDLGGIPLNLVLALQDFYQPKTFVFGVAYALGNLELSLDVEYQKWSDYSPSKVVEINFGSELKDFDDIFIPKLGIEYKIDDGLSVLGGYYYEPSFVPDDADTGRLNFLDNDKHVASMGLSYALPDKFMGLKGQMEINCGFQAQYLVDRDVKKTSPTDENPSYSYGGTAYSFIIGGSLNL